MRAELKRLHVETGSTILYVTHDQLEALTLSTDVAILDKGTLQQWSPPMDVYNQPANVFTADFIGNPRINLIEGVLEKRDDKLVVVARQMEIPLTSSKDLSGFLGKTLKVGLRAEDFVLSNTAAEGLLIAEVESVLPAGSEWFVRVRIGQEVVMTSTTNDPWQPSAIQFGLRLRTKRSSVLMGKTI